MSVTSSIVFLGASPTNQPPVGVKEELAGLEQSLKPQIEAGTVRLVSHLDSQPLDILRYLIDEKPQIFHFSGHGTPDHSLVLETAEGLTAVATPDALRNTFRALQGSVRLVFLNACFSEVQAATLLETVDFVIGMNDAIGDDAAIRFAEFFYKAIGRECSVQEAFDAGLAALDLERIPEADIPVLRHADFADVDRPLVVGPESPDKSTRRTIELHVPPSLTPQQGYQYGLKVVREGIDPDDRPLIDRDRNFVGDAEILRCVVEYEGTWGLQFRCFMVFPGDAPSDGDLPGDWIDKDVDGNRLWFRLRGNQDYVEYDAGGGVYKNNYLRHRSLPGVGRVAVAGAGGVDPRAAVVDPQGGNGIGAPAVDPRAAVQQVGGGGPAAGAVRRDVTEKPAITIDPHEFIATLEPGDVLLFDSLHPLTRLIQFVENRPVSHAALYLGGEEGGETFAQVTRHTSTDPATQERLLRTRLRDHPGPYDRTVTALRHVDAQPESADAVLRRAREYMQPDSKYAYLSLVALLPGCLRRSYKLYLDGGRLPTRTLGRALQAASNLILSVLNAGETGRDLKPQREKSSLTCSSFVYRCFMESGSDLDVEVTEPMLPWGSGSLRAQDVAGRPVRGVSPSAVDRFGVVDGIELIGFEPSLISMLADDQGTRRRPTRAVTDGDADDQLGEADAAALYASARALAGLEAQFSEELVSHNLESGGYGGRNVRGAGLPRGAVEGQVIPDFVTPRDFWSSPSFRVVSVLHRPPDRSVDSDLDAMH